MIRLRFYQLSLRRLLLLTALSGGGLWIGLAYIGQLTPQRGETLVPPGEQRILQAMSAEFRLTFATPSPFM